MRRAGNAQRRHLSDDALLVQIKAIHDERRDGYGRPRTWKELLARGMWVDRDWVQKLMWQNGIRAKAKRRFKAATNSKHDLPIAATLRNCEFTGASQTSFRWVASRTSPPTRAGCSCPW